MKKLFLDDERMPKDCASYMKYNKKDYLEDNWDIVRNYNEFVKYIENCGPHGLPYLISFDHDLADEHYTPESLWDDFIFSKIHQESKYENFKEKTGNDCAKFLIDYLQQHNVDLEDYPKWIVHSMNPVGASYIASTLLQGEKYKKEEKELSTDIPDYIVHDAGLYLKQQPFINPSAPSSPGISRSHFGIEFPSYQTFEQPVFEQSKKLAEDIVRERRERTQQIIDNGYKITSDDDSFAFKKPKIATKIPKQEEEDFIEEVFKEDTKEEISMIKPTKKDLLIAGLIVFGSIFIAILHTVLT